MADVRTPSCDKPQPGQVAAETTLFALAYVPLSMELVPQVSLYFYFLILMRFVSLRWPGLTPGRWSLLPLTFGGIVNVYHAYHTVVGQEAGTALLASMLALKLLETRQVRDIRFGSLLFGFLLVTQFLFDQSPGLALFLTVLLVLNFALMADLCRRVPRPLYHSVTLALRLTLQALPLAVVLFILFPRLDAPLWNLNPVENTGKSGVKPWLEPGSVSELVIDGSLAFRVRFDGPIPDPQRLYWRGPVAWNTDGRRWLPAEPHQFPRLEATPKAALDPVSYVVTLEPTGQRWLFALDLPAVTTAEGARITHDFQVLAADRILEPKVYRMESALTYHSGDLPLEEEAAGLQLPHNVTDRMRALVADWQERAKTPEELIQQGLGYFNQEPFHYTLLPPKLGENPADEFLFETKRGFCEHYASSFALMMRIGGIPSRIVMGYLGGELNPLGGHLIVRQSDAHAWIEVWLAGKGWMRIDPTAAVAPSRVERSDLLADLGAGSPLRFRVHGPDRLANLIHGMRLLADAVDENWRHWVLEFDRARQQTMLESAGLGYLREYGLALAMIVGAGAFIGLLGLGLARNTARQRRNPAEKLYLRFCERLDRAGFRRREHEGPLDYGRRIVLARRDLRGPVEAFIGLYTGMRYGRTENNAENLRRLRTHLKRIRSAAAR